MLNYFVSVVLDEKPSDDDFLMNIIANFTSSAILAELCINHDLIVF